MNTKRVLIKPVITEKSNMITEKEDKYVFVVDRKANKNQIKNAIEDFFDVEVEAVNTAVIPGKSKTRYTKQGVVKGMKSAYKKAYITLKEGQSIDLYS